MKKYELVKEQKINSFGRTLFRIKACVDFVTISGEEVHTGDLGGFIETENNLSHDGKAWVGNDVRVWGDACVYDNAEVYGNARVFGDAWVFGNARIRDDVWVRGNAKVCENARILGHAKVSDYAEVYGNALISGVTEVYGHAKIRDNAEIFGNARICGDARICGHSKVGANACVFGNAKVCGDARIFGDGYIRSIEHVFYASPIDSYGHSITLFRNINNEIDISFGYKSYSIEDFKELISKWDDREKEVAIGAVELAQKYIDLSF